MKWEQFAAKQPVLSTGLKYGAGLGVILLLLAIIADLLGGSSIVNTGLRWINVAVVGLCYLRVGYLAARRTDRLSSGTMTGLVTGLVAYIINLVGHLIVLPIYISLAHTEQTTHLTASAQIAAATQTLFYWMVIYGILAGIVLGFMGSNIGIHRAERPISKPSAPQVPSSDTTGSEQ